MIDYIPYKGRRLDTSKRVRVYRNLNNGSLSIKQGGHIVGHAQEVTLMNATFIVSDSGHSRFLREGVKNVHAYVEGYVTVSKKSFNGLRVSYNPSRLNYFFKCDTMEKITNASIIKIYRTGNMYATGVK